MAQDKNYTMLHCHTMLSNGVTNIDSITKYTDYVNKAKECGMKAFAYSEHGSVFEWYHKKMALEKVGIKYIHTEEFYITESLEVKVRDNYHCIVGALNYDGFLELNRLSSKSFNREDGSFYYVPRITFEDLINTSDNLFISTACLGGILHKGNDGIRERFIEFLTKNKHRCFLEIQPHIDPLQVEYNKYLYKLYQSNGIRLVCCTDTHALNDNHVKGRSILQKSKNIYFEGEDNFDLTFKTYDELVDACKRQNALPLDVYLEAIENTNVIADMVEPFEIDYSYKYPHLWGDDSDEYFKRKIMDGIKKRGVDKYPNYDEYIERIKYELKAYRHNQAIDFMLLMQDIIEWCETQDIRVGYGRGSCNGSVIAWLLGITEMDSIKYKLNFDRFMNIERVSLSDIDTDFPPSRIDEVKQYIFNKHGLHCADIITFNTIALKGAIRDVARALEMPLDVVGDICDKCEIAEEQLREQYKELFSYVDLVNGTIVSVGNHPCFLGEELVLTDSGYKEIKEVSISDRVLTHNNRFMEVAKIMSKKESEYVLVRPSGTLPIKTTKNHPFYVRRREDVRLRKHKDGVDTTVKNYLQPEWINVENINKGDLVGIPINDNDIIPKAEGLDLTNVDIWWLIGRYLGDGWCTDVKNRAEKYLVICCDDDETKNEKQDIIEVLERCKINYRLEKRTDVYRIYIKDRNLYNYLAYNFGKYSHGKYIPNEVVDLPIDLLHSFFNGYMSADGSYLKERNSYSFKTVSKKMALGLIMCVAKLYNRHCTVCVIKPDVDCIKGRMVNRKEKYAISFTKDKRKLERSMVEDGYIWMPIKDINEIKEEVEVYNLSVFDDNSYTINNISVHNCGIIVAPESIDDRLGLFTTSTDTVPISQINMKEVDAQNYVKLDLLKLDTIELINETCKLANIDRLTPDNMDTDDDKVWNAMRDDTTQIFQWEGDTGDRYIKSLLSDSTIEKFISYYGEIDKAILVSIGNSAIRPAGASYREQLASGEIRLTGFKPLDDFLAPTMGQLCFQEQILEFLHEYCGFTMGEADIVRRGFAKKTGTEQFIPVIKDGGYLNEGHYIEGFVKTMNDKYNMSDKEAEDAIIYFVDVINRASDYLFSLNHSQPYTLLGYASAWLRYYYPLEFLTVALNINRNKEDKTKGLTTYANKIGIKILSPKFGKSKAQYFLDKETNSIYKGIGSIKNLNDTVSDQLYELSKSHYSDFFNLLKVIKEHTKLNSKQLDILIKLDYFSQFGHPHQLLAQVDIYADLSTLYNKFKTVKNPSKSLFEELSIPLSEVATIADKESLKQFTITDSEALLKLFKKYYKQILKQVSAKYPYQPTTILDKIKYEVELLGYTDLIDESVSDGCYIVCGVEANSYGTLFAQLYQINSGYQQTYKVDKAWAKESLIKVGDILNCFFDVRQKGVYQEVDGKKKWVKIDEYETVLKKYSIK